MSAPTSTPRMCPLLGLAQDSGSAHLYASDQHRCYATGERQAVSASHQEQFCLTRSYAYCPIFLAAQTQANKARKAATAQSALAVSLVPENEPSDALPHDSGARLSNLSRATLIGALAILLLVIGYFAVMLLRGAARSSDDSTPAAALLATRTPTAALLATATSILRPTLAGTPTAVEPPRPTLPPGGELISVNPSLNAAGWVASNERSGNHFDDSIIQVGAYNRVSYYGVVQFDLAAIPPNTQAVFASLEITGLNDERLGQGTWQVKTVKLPPDKPISSMNFEDVRLLNWDYLLQPTLTREQLGKGRANRFELDGPVLGLLQQQFGRGKVTFRIEGPSGATDSLFVWDVGLGSDGLGSRPVLSIGIKSGPVQQPQNIVLIPCVPTPATQAERQARAATATYVATVFGTPTPHPTNYVTPKAVTPISTEEALFRAATATAQGTPQAVPTATPANWVLPFVVTSTPTPSNQATATYQRALATAQAATTGTPTPLPCYVWTATPLPPTPTPTETPVIIIPSVSPSPTPSQTPTPNAIPPILSGRIAFMSDRDGAPALFVMEPDGRVIGRLSNPWSYDTAYAQQMTAANGTYKLSVTGDKLVRTKIILSIAGALSPKTLFENGSINYDPIFSPDGYNIAFVSIGTGADEIYRINRDGGGLLQLTSGSTWQWNKHPVWSPDGKSILFWSNRDSGRRQLWIMDADGKNMRNLSNDGFNDWDPVWYR